MNIIIPMAGRGTRLRPHTLTTPKPLIKLAGKTIVQRLVEEISASFEEAIDNIGFVVGDFGTERERGGRRPNKNCRKVRGQWAHLLSREALRNSACCFMC